MKATVLVDSQEKVNYHITDRLKELNIPFKIKKLSYGDYSFEWNGLSYENKIVVERKNSVGEITGNFTKGRTRFQNEFKRAKGCKVILMIEDNLERLEGHEYRSRMSPNDVTKFLKTWSNHFQLELKFVEKAEACEFMLGKFREYLKERKE